MWPLSPDVTPRGWLGSRHQPTNSVVGLPSAVHQYSPVVCGFKERWSRRLLGVQFVAFSPFLSGLGHGHLEQTAERKNGLHMLRALCDWKPAEERRRTRTKGFVFYSVTVPSFSLTCFFFLFSIVSLSLSLSLKKNHPLSLLFTTVICINERKK